jgi:uncharacterized phiE125 gp8 family phage protein
MPLKLVETAPPALEPVTLAEAKAQLRVTGDAEDALIAGLIAAARQICEDYTGLALIERGYSLFLDAWPEEITLPRPPLLSIAGIDLFDAAGAAAEFPASHYIADAAGRPGRIVLAEGMPPPAPGRAVNGIEIKFTAGFGDDPAAVPAALRQGILLLVAQLYSQRGDAGGALQLSGALALFQPFRIMSLR